MKKLLTTREIEPIMMNMMNFLNRSDIAVFTAATNDDLLRLHIEKQADLIVTDLDTPGLASETMFNIIRRGESIRNVSIILICGNKPEERNKSKLSTVNAVFSRPLDPALFAGKVQELLNVAPRRSYRVVLSVAVDGRHNNRPFICSSENISAHGMLIRTAEPLAPSDHIDCSFYLPDGTRVSASGEVVRFAGNSSAAQANRYGIRFLKLASDFKYAITSFVERERTTSYHAGVAATALSA